MLWSDSGLCWHTEVMTTQSAGISPMCPTLRILPVISKAKLTNLLSQSKDLKRS